MKTCSRLVFVLVSNPKVFPSATHDHDYRAAEAVKVDYNPKPN